MVKLKTNHRHQAKCMKSQHARRNFSSLTTSANLKRWIIILFLFYKLDYKDYYCYGISSSSAILNNENGKDRTLFHSLSLYLFVSHPKVFLFLFLAFSSFQLKVNLLSLLPYSLGCFMPFAAVVSLLFFSVFLLYFRDHPDFNPINARKASSLSFAVQSFIQFAILRQHSITK